MPKIIIAHRWSGSPKSDWYPWLREELENRGFEVEIPLMGDRKKPTISQWTKNLEEAIGEPDENTIIVAHSIGVQTTLRYLESLKKEQKIKSLVSVAGWFHLENLEDEETKEIARLWIKTPINLKKVKNSVKEITAFFSDNDPFVPLSDSEIFEKELGAKIIIKKRAGHITEEDGFKKLPEVLAAVLEVLKS